MATTIRATTLLLARLATLKKGHEPPLSGMNRCARRLEIVNRPTMVTQMTKVSFDLDHTDWHGHPAESLWAAPVPEISPTAFRLQNSSFFVRGVSYLDIVDTTSNGG